MIYADQNIEAANVSIGQTTGHVLTVIAPGEVGWQGVSGASGQVGTLQSVTTNASTTDIETGFLNTVTSLTASGNVLVTGNVTASKFIGSGLELTGVALATDLNSNSSRISDIETCVTGDILYASATNTLSKLAIGGVGQVLKSDGTVPVWGTDVTGSGSSTGMWTETGVNDVIHYSAGNVGINTSTPTTDLQIGSNVNISDTNDDKLVITGNVYVSRNLRVIDEIKTFSLTTTQLLVKTVEVTAVRQSRNLVI